MVAVGHGKVTRCVSDASAMQQRIDGGLLMGDGACTVAPSLTLRVTIGAFTRPRYRWCERGRWPWNGNPTRQRGSSGLMVDYLWAMERVL